VRETAAQLHQLNNAFDFHGQPRPPLVLKQYPGYYNGG
jgi:hypothetical protein